MIADHIVFPVDSISAYPCTLDHKHPSGDDALETFPILSFEVDAAEQLRSCGGGDAADGRRLIVGMDQIVVSNADT